MKKTSPTFHLTIFGTVVDDVTHEQAAHRMVEAIRDGVSVEVVVVRDDELGRAASIVSVPGGADPVDEDPDEGVETDVAYAAIAEAARKTTDE